MGNNMDQLNKLCNEYRENKRMVEELQEINDNTKNQIIELMHGAETLIIGSNKITYKDVHSIKCDSSILKKRTTRSI